MKAREREEVPKMAAIVAMTAARSIVEGNGPNNDKVGEVIPVLGTMSSPAIRAHSPVYLNRDCRSV